MQAGSLKTQVFPGVYGTLFSLLRACYTRTGFTPKEKQVHRALLISGLHTDKVKAVLQAYRDLSAQPPTPWDIDALVEEYQERCFTEGLETAVKCLSETVKLPNKEVVGGVPGARKVLYLVEREMDVHETTNTFDAVGRYARDLEAGGLPTIELPLLNPMVNIFRKELWLLAAFAGQGKSTLMHNLAVDSYLKGEKVLIISLETEAHKIRYRLATILAAKRGTPISYNKVIFRTLSQAELSIFYGCLKELRVIRVRDCLGTGVYEILGTLRAERDATLIFLDNLNLCATRSKKFFEIIGETLKTLFKYIHNSKNQTMIILAQTNREGYRAASEKGSYSLLGIADTPEAERSPDGVMWCLITDFLKTRLGVSKSREFPPNQNQYLELGFDPNTLVFTADGVAAGGAGLQSNRKLIDLEEN